MLYLRKNMSFVRDLYFFILLIVLFLFVLQGVDAKCEKNSKKIKSMVNSIISNVSSKK